MSGVEIIGVIASIVQIAELGGRLSVKLCTFCHKFKNANKALRYLSKDVALTCNVLRQLGESLGQDDLACLYSPDAFETAQDVLRECEQVFQDLESAIEQHYPDPLSQSRVDKMARKLKFMMNESHLDTVAGNLERLKSTMLLMLNVVIYAGQIRSRRETHELQEQRNLLLVLTSEKIESERNYEKLTRTLQYTSITEKAPYTENLDGGDQPYETKDELYHYCQMVKSVLHEINAVQQLLDRDRYLRVRSGFINVHKAEALTLQHIHGQRAISLFRTHLNDSFRVDTSMQARNPLNSASETVQVLPSLQSAINFNRANVIKSPSSQPNASELSPQQMRERAMLISREFHHSQPVQQAPGQIDPLHSQQVQLPPLEVLQSRAMQLQNQQQLQRQMLNIQNRPVSQSPPVPQIPIFGQQMQQQQMQMQQRQQFQSRPMAQAPSVPQMQLNRPDLNQIDQPSPQPRRMHQSAPSKSFGSDLPIISPPPYQERVQSRSEIPDHSMAAKARRPISPKLPVPTNQPSKSDVKQSSPESPVPDPSGFALDFSMLDNPGILESFNFDIFLEPDDVHKDYVRFVREQIESARYAREQIKSDKVSSGTVPSGHKSQPQPDEPMPRASGDSNPKRKSKKRKMNAVASAEDSLESQSNTESMPKDEQSKRIHLDSSIPTDETISTVTSPAPKAGTETQIQVPASTEDQPSASEDPPTEGLDAWILRWTTLEQTEL